jgi:hypothetical protein
MAGNAELRFAAAAMRAGGDGAVCTIAAAGARVSANAMTIATRA